MVLLLACATAGLLCEVAAWSTSSRASLNFYAVYLANGFIAILTLVAGTTAILLASFAYRLTRSNAPVQLHSRIVDARLASIANRVSVLATAQASTAFALALLIVVESALIELDTSESTRLTLTIITFALVVALVVTEALIAIRLGRRKGLTPADLDTITPIRNGRWTLDAAIASVIAVVSLKILGQLRGGFDDALTFFAGGIFAAYVRLTFRMLRELRIQLTTASKCLRQSEPISSIAFVCLMMLFYVVNQTGHNFNATRPTEIWMTIKRAIGYALGATAIWALINLVVESFRFRRAVAQTQDSLHSSQTATPDHPDRNP